MKTFTSKALAMKSKPTARQKVQSIQQGSYYDIPGRIKRMGRSIESGEYGDVTDALVILRYHDEGRLNVKGFHYGTSNVEVAQSMCSRIFTRLMAHDA
jgi:hypothetical protein